MKKYILLIILTIVLTVILCRVCHEVDQANRCISNQTSHCEIKRKNTEDNAIKGIIIIQNEGYCFIGDNGNGELITIYSTNKNSAEVKP